eukprot:3832381-Pleurochrysis_carterae.AAC.1
MGSDIVTANGGTSPFAWAPGNTSKWIAVAVYARRCINQSDCLFMNNTNNTQYTAVRESGHSTVLQDGWGMFEALPPSIERLTPCFGTTRVNQTNAGSLVLTRKTLLILFRAANWGTAFDGGTWGASEWTLFSSTPGRYLTGVTSDIYIYTKVVESGSYLLDTQSAFYLFADAHGLGPT